MNAAGGDITASPVAAGRRVGWSPHPDHTLIISFDKPGLVKIIGGAAMPQTFAIPRFDPAGPEDQDRIFEFTGEEPEYGYTGLLVTATDTTTGISTYETLDGPTPPNPPIPPITDAPPRRPRIRVVVGLDHDA